MNLSYEVFHKRHTFVSIYCIESVISVPLTGINYRKWLSSGFYFSSTSYELIFVIKKKIRKENITDVIEEESEVSFASFFELTQWKECLGLSDGKR